MVRFGIVVFYNLFHLLFSS